MFNNIFLFLLFISIASCSAPKALFKVENSSKQVPSNIKFSNLSKSADHFVWDFGDEQFSELRSPNHLYTLSGLHIIKLTAIKGEKQNVFSDTIILNAPSDCLVIFETSLGQILLKLFDETPIHRDNFLSLIENGFYDGVMFHRVINGFMIQAGEKEFINKKDHHSSVANTLVPEIKKGLVHIKGALAAARLPDEVNPNKNSSRSQFYIVHGKTFTEEQLQFYELQKGIKYTEEQRNILLNIGGAPQLDKEYTVFGEVLSGLEIIDKIASSKTDEHDRPIQEIKIIKATIIN